ITIALDSQEFDPFLLLVGPDGEVVEYNDDVSRNSLSAGMSVTLPLNGRYYVYANALDSSGFGRFRLSVEAR
ncbi:MAG: serine protease, partial [Phormidesmis sp.]